MQQQIDQLRVQLSHALDNNTRLIQKQLRQVLGNVNERLKENAIVLGLKGMKVEERAKEIIQYLSRLRGDLENFVTILACWGDIWVTLRSAIKLSRNVSSNSARDSFRRMRTRSPSNCAPTIARWDSQVSNSEDFP